MTLARINANASGAWAAREGEVVTVIDVKPNGLATGVLLKGAKRPAYIPTRWIDDDDDLERRTP